MRLKEKPVLSPRHIMLISCFLFLAGISCYNHFLLWSVMVIIALFFLPRASVKVRTFWLLMFCAGVFRMNIQHDTLEQVIQRARYVVTQHNQEEHLLRIVSEVTSSGHTRQFTGTILGYQSLARVRLESYEELFQGDVLMVQGELTIPENFDDSSFDYITYLLKDHIHLVLMKAQIVTHYHGPTSLFRSLEELKRMLQLRILARWPGDAGEWIAGILLGTKGSLSQSLEEAFRRTGLAHIVAISGFNITIIIIFMQRLLHVFKQNTRLIVAGIGIVLFVMFVGPSAPVLRAGIMGVLGLVALLSRNKSQILLLLMYSAVIMCIINPYALQYDVGFQLSFMAVLGLLFIEPITRTWFLWAPKAFAISETLSGTFAAQIITLPLTLYYFESFSIISPLANLLVTPVIPFSMLSSFIATLITFLPKPLSEVSLVVALPTQYIVERSLDATYWLSSFNFATLEVHQVSDVWQVALCYLIITIWVKRFQQRKSNDLQRSKSTI